MSPQKKAVTICEFDYLIIPIQLKLHAYIRQNF